MKKKVKKLKYEFVNSCGGKKVKGKCFLNTPTLPLFG